MHVVHLIPFLSTAGGGITEAALGLTEALSAREDIRITVLSAKDASDTDRWKTLETAEFSMKMLEWLKPDLVHFHGLWTPLSLAAKRFAPNTIVSPHGMLDSWALAQSEWKKKAALALFERENISRAGAIHALNRAEAEAAEEYGTCHIIPNGVNLPELDNDSPESKKLLFLGRIHPKKGISELIEAWRESVAFNAGWRLDIAGWDDGGHQKHLEEDIPEGVTFVGPKFGAEKDALLKEASAFVLPSYSEGLPMAILEAWSHQLPVIMTPECNLPEGFDRGAAIHCSPTSIRSALDKLVLMGDKERIQMGVNGRTLVEERYTWPEIAEQFSALYRDILKRGN